MRSKPKAMSMLMVIIWNALLVNAGYYRYGHNSNIGNWADIDAEPVELVTFNGQAAYFEIFTNGSSQESEENIQEPVVDGGHGGNIEIYTGVNDVNEGDGRDGNLNRSIILCDEERFYKYVGFTDGTLTSNDRFVTITVKGNVVIHCQHNFMANIKADYSEGPPHVTIHAGNPQAIKCYADGRFAGTSQMLPHAVGCYFMAPNSNMPMQGGTFIFRTKYQGDMNIFLCADGGPGRQGGNGGQIKVMNHGGDIRGEASATGGYSYSNMSNFGAEGTIHLEATRAVESSTIVGKFRSALNPFSGDEPNSRGNNLELIADTVMQLPADVGIQYDYVASPDVDPDLLLDLIPRKPLSDGVFVGRVETAGSDSRIEIKTGVTVDVGDGRNGPLVASAAILEPGIYNLTYACGSPDWGGDLTVYVKGNTTIRCQYWFNATIKPYPSCQTPPRVEIYAGIPISPIEDALDPAWLRWSMAHCCNHSLNMDSGTSGAFGMFMGDYAVGTPNGLRKAEPWEAEMIDNEINNSMQAGNSDLSLEALIFKTMAHGRIEANIISTGTDEVQMPWFSDKTLPGGTAVMMASQGDLRVEQIKVCGIPGGEIYCLADNITIWDSLCADGNMWIGGPGGDGGRIYLEARDYQTNEPGVIEVSDYSPSGSWPISACGGLGDPPGNGGYVTIVPEEAVSEDCIKIQNGYGTPVNDAINVWWPDLTEILAYEYEESSTQNMCTEDAGFDSLAKCIHYSQAHLMYVIGNRGKLYTIDVRTGGARLVGQLHWYNHKFQPPQKGWMGIDALTFGPERTLYGWGQGNRMYTVDPLTACAAPAGSSFISPRISTMVFDEEKTLWAASGRSLFRVDPKTGIPTLFANNVSGGAATMTFDRNWNMFILSPYGSVHKVDRQDGTSTYIGNLQPNGFGATHACRRGPDGQVYAVRYDGTLLSVDLEALTWRKLAETSVRCVVAGAFPLEAVLNGQ